MRIVLVALASLAALSLGATLSKPSMEHCWSIMEKEGLSDRFPGAVSHAIHSLTLQDLKHYFDLDARENNGVPVINLDLKAKEVVLMNAPYIGYEEKFMTMGLRAVDKVLAHMDNPDFDIAHYTILERLVHTLHMQEVWQMMKVHYDKLVTSPPKDNQVCKCVNDIENNGVLKFLHYMALKIRYPETMYGKSIRMSKDDPQTFGYKDIPITKLDSINGQYGWEGNLYKFEFPKEREYSEAKKVENFKDASKYGWEGNLYKFEFPKRAESNAAVREEGESRYGWDGNLYKFEFPKGEVSKNVEKNGSSVKGKQFKNPWQVKDEGVKHITDSAAWKIWKNMMLHMDVKDHYEAAYFVYCALNHRLPE